MFKGVTNFSTQAYKAAHFRSGNGTFSLLGAVSELRFSQASLDFFSGPDPSLRKNAHYGTAKIIQQRPGIFCRSRGMAVILKVGEG